MATQVTPVEHLFRYQSFQINKSQPLGHGSYGAVYKANCDQLPCAAKILHTTIVDPSNHDPGALKIMHRFCQECALLKSIRHPNIVQYLAVTLDPESRPPVLLMELLDESLTKMLERSQQSLAYYIQVDICHDSALAIAYLHSNNIIHRDLSSNNVLIIAGRRAKVTDFGMTTLAVAAPTMTPLTMCPGTLAYMPPEALREPPRYTNKLDCFSEGVIMIQVCTRLWPEPGPRTKLVPFSASPTGSIEMPVLETERRKNHIDLIDSNHALLPIAMDYLKYNERERPSSEELCQRLAGLKDSNHYRDNVRQHQDEIQAKDIQILSQNQQLLEKDRRIQDIERAVQEKDKLIQDMERENQDKERALLDKEREIALRERQLRQLNQQLEEHEEVTAEFQQTNHSLQRQVERLLSLQIPDHKPQPPKRQVERLQQLSLQIPDHKPQPPKRQVERLQQLSQQIPDHKPPKEQKMTLNWRDGGKPAPFKMFRGAAVVNKGVAYFMNWDGQTCSYSSTIIKKKWSELPQYTYRRCSIAVVSGQLTAIGGHDSTYTETNELLSLHHSNGWSHVFPPMPTKRYDTTATTSKKHLIVAGGSTGQGSTDTINTVEVMDTKTLVWSTVASLPHPYEWASATICGDHLYMLGGDDGKTWTKSVLTCSLTELLQSSSSSSSVWHRVADIPAFHSTCIAVSGQLLAVGGRDDHKPMAAIHKYNQRTNSWVHISNMPIARYLCLVAVLPPMR